MYAVIFKAEIKQIDQRYFEMARDLRALAIKEFGCTEFTANTENGFEIALSYWSSLEQIKAWQVHPLHLQAQQLGKSLWYKTYQVQIVEIIREYSGNLIAQN